MAGAYGHQLLFMNAKWQAIENFPPAPNEWSVLIAPFGIHLVGKERVSKALKNALPLNPVLVSTPEGTQHYLPPLLIDEAGITARMEQNARYSALMALVSLMAGATIALLFGEYEFALIWILALGAVTVQAFLAFKACKDPNHLKQRWMFYGWCATKGGRYGFLFTLFMILCGLVQVVLAQTGSGNESVLETYGLIYSAPWNGELWRILTSPLVHLNVPHWIVNTMLGTGVMFIVGPVSGTHWTVTALVLGSMLGLASVSLLHPIVGWDSYGIAGISGGISALIGLLFGCCLRLPACFPTGFGRTILAVSITLLIAGSLITNVTGTLAHAVGFVIGVSLGWNSRSVSPNFKAS